MKGYSTFNLLRRKQSFKAFRRDVLVNFEGGIKIPDL